MQQQMPDPLQMVRQEIQAKALERSSAHYNLDAAKRQVVQLEAVIAKCDAEIAVLEQTQAVLGRMNQQLSAQMAQAQAQQAQPSQPATAPSLANDGAPAHIVQEEQPAARARTTQTRPKVTKNGKRMGRPPGSGRKPVKMQDEVTVAGYNGNGMTPGEAASE